VLVEHRLAVADAALVGDEPKELRAQVGRDGHARSLCHAPGRLKPFVHVPFVSGESAMRLAFTVTPLSALVPLTNAHIFTAMSDAFTVFVSSSAVFDETVTVVVVVVFVEPNERPFTVSVEPLTFVIDPNANPKFPVPKPPDGRGVVPVLGVVPVRGGRVPVPPPRPKKPPAAPHCPFTGAEIEMRCAATTPFALRVPIALTHAPTFRLERGAVACSVIVAEPADTSDLPVGLSEVVIVNVDPFTDTTGPETEPCTGVAAVAAAGSNAKSAASATGTKYILILNLLSRRRSRWRLR